MREKIWKGSLSFGLVDIPIVLRPAETREELSFTMLDRRDLSPIGFRKVNKTTGRDVPSKDVVRGYECPNHQYVVLTEEDFKRAGHERSRRLEIIAFVDAADIDPAYFEKPYYLEPAAKNEKAYALLREALRRAGKAGIATIILYHHEHLAAVMPRGNVLMLEILRFNHELRDPSELRLPDEDARKLHLSEAELKMAERLVADLSAQWKPEDFKDRYRQELLALIERKAKAGEGEPAPEPEKPEKWEPPKDILDLLKKSVARAESARPRGPHRFRHYH